MDDARVSRPETKFFHESPVMEAALDRGATYVAVGSTSWGKMREVGVRPTRTESLGEIRDHWLREILGEIIDQDTNFVCVVDGDRLVQIARMSPSEPWRIDAWKCDP